MIKSLVEFEKEVLGSTSRFYSRIKKRFMVMLSRTKGRPQHSRIIVRCAPSNPILVSKSVLQKVDNGQAVQKNRIAHQVKGHFRSLPEGYKASSKQIEFAESLGLKLETGKTFVREYRTK